MSAVPQSVIDRIKPEYAGRRVLVTGGASFIGSHLTEALVSAGASVTVADDLSSGEMANIDAVRDDVRFVEGDLRSSEVAERAVGTNEIVFHLAAQHGGRGYIESHPVEVLNNMSLDHTVFAASARAQVGKIIFASSACAYPTILQDSATDWQWLSEDDANFQEPGKAFADGEYGWSKLVTEMQLRAFHKQYGIDGISMRLFTAYGERENESHAAVALIAKALAKMDPYPIWGDGTQTRNFTYVGDTCAGMLLSGAFLSGYEVMNCGSPHHISINAFVDAVFDTVGWRPNEMEYQLDKPVGVKSRAADCMKCDKLLGWQPEYELYEGVRRTVEWYSGIVTPERLANLGYALMER